MPLSGSFFLENTGYFILRYNFLKLIVFILFLKLKDELHNEYGDQENVILRTYVTKYLIIYTYTHCTSSFAN